MNFVRTLPAPALSLNFEQENKKATLFCDFDLKGVVRECSYVLIDYPEQQVYFEAFCQFAQGNTFDNVLEFSHDDVLTLIPEVENATEQMPFFLIPSLLFQELLKQYQGEVQAYPAGTLLCRCFGISEEQIYAFFQKEQESSLQDVCKNLSAGNGCGNCQTDIAEIYAELYQQDLPLKLERKDFDLERAVRAFFMGHDYSADYRDLKLELDQVRLFGQPVDQQLKEDLEKFLEANLNKKFTISFS